MIEFLKKHWLVVLLGVLAAYIVLKIWNATTAVEQWFLKLSGWALLFSAALASSGPVALALLVSGGLSILNNFYSLFPAADWIQKLLTGYNLTGNASNSDQNPALNPQTSVDSVLGNDGGQDAQSAAYLSGQTF